MTHPINSDDWTRTEALAAVGPGWATLINRLYDLMSGECSALPITVVQVKEKLGGLRFYWWSCVEKPVNDDPRWQQWKDAVDQAERDSYTICEKCGAPGQTTTTGWVKTLCPMHTTERQQTHRSPTIPNTLEVL